MPESSSAQLTARLKRILSAARVELTTLPDVPEIALHLLNGDFSSAALSQDEMHAALNYPAYWAFCWASGQVLARYLLDHPECVRGRTVLDFGCGSGVAAIAAAKAGAARVIACDLDADALLATRLNAAANGVELELAEDFQAVRDPLDLILVADVLYDRANLGWLPLFLQRAPRVLLADSRVKNFTEPNYWREGTYTSTTWPDLDEFDEFRQVQLYWGSTDPAASAAPATPATPAAPADILPASSKS